MSTKKIETFFTARGVKPVCEVCNQNTWSLTQDDMPMVVKLATETLVPTTAPNLFTQTAPTGALGGLGGMGALGQALGAPPVLQRSVPSYGNLNAYAIVCMNCGNIRLHAEVVVKDAAGL